MHEHAQRAARRDARILLPQRSCRGIARIGVGRLARLDLCSVEVGKGLDREEDLAPDLDQVRHLVTGEPGRDTRDGARVEGDVLSRATVSTGEGTGESSLLVEQVDREAIDLEFTQVVAFGAAGLTLDAPGPRPHVVGIEGVVEAEHPLAVVDGRELGREDRPAHDLGGALRCAEGRVGVLERRQPSDDPVVLPIAEGGCVLDVIGKLRRRRRLGEALPLLLIGVRDGGWVGGPLARRVLGTHGAILPHHADTEGAEYGSCRTRGLGSWTSTRPSARTTHATAVRDGVIIYRDSDHLTVRATQHLVEPLTRAIAALDSDRTH